MGRKVWGRGATVTAADINTYLMDQSVMTFATAAARTTAIPSPTQGMVTWRNNASGPIKLEYYDGSSWVAISFTSPAQTVQGQSSIQVLNQASLTAAADTWTAWTSGGTSPGSTSYLTDVSVDSSGSFGTDVPILIEFSLDGGSTVWKRTMVLCSNSGTTLVAVACTPRSAPASSTVHFRWKTQVSTSSSIVKPTLTWSQTAPAVTLSAAESLWESAAASTTYGTWTTLGTVSGAHRLLSVASAGLHTEAGLATGAGSTVIARWDAAVMYMGHNRAVPSGSLKVSGTAALVYVLTEPV